MSGVTAAEWEFLSFFEVEPQLRDSDAPWCYNDALYRVRQGQLSLSFAIAPSYCDVRIILIYNHHTIYELRGSNKTVLAIVGR
jgi:hypothetical protein